MQFQSHNILIYSILSVVMFLIFKKLDELFPRYETSELPESKKLWKKLLLVSILFSVIFLFIKGGEMNEGKL